MASCRCLDPNANNAVASLDSGGNCVLVFKPEGEQCRSLKYHPGSVFMYICWGFVYSFTYGKVKRVAKVISKSRDSEPKTGGHSVLFRVDSDTMIQDQPLYMCYD